MLKNNNSFFMKQMDEIRIRELEIYANHGVFAEETRLGQKFFVNAVLYTDTRAAGREDDLDRSTNYGTVCQVISEFLTQNTYQLLEAAAEHLAEKLLLTFPLIRALQLEIRKPSAPIPLPFGSVSVCITRGWRQAVIACGSNMGEKEDYIRFAAEKIAADEKCRLLDSAELLVTKPYGGVEQDDFVNGAFLVETLYEPEELLTFLNRLEAEAGRERIIHWGPRTLDLDIIFYEDEVIRTERLIVPHADMHNRSFVLKPLMQIAPQWIHPIYQKTAAELLAQLPDQDAD